MTETTQNAGTTETKTRKRKATKMPVKASAPKTKKPAPGTPGTQGIRAAVADAKTAEAKQRKAERASFVTFAFRFPKAESAALHKAAGPANASRTMRALAAAFVSEDRAAFEVVVEDAKKLR